MSKRKVFSKTADNNHQVWVKSTLEGILWEILNQRQAVASQTLITQELRCCLLESFREKSALSGCIYFQKIMSQGQAFQSCSHACNFFDHTRATLLPVPFDFTSGGKWFMTLWLYEMGWQKLGHAKTNKCVYPKQFLKSIITYYHLLIRRVLQTTTGQPGLEFLGFVMIYAYNKRLKLTTDTG
jgi:hypothetical protein